MNAAVIVDTRRIDLSAVVENHLKHLPDFDLVVYCYEKEWIEQTLGKFNPTICTIKYWALTESEYNMLLTTPDFWNPLIEYKRVVIFQHDSGILRDGIGEFLQYDYVGAPWKFQEHGGNGGLSVRNPRLMKQICEKFPHRVYMGNEDVYFSNYTKEIGNLAPREICEKFSVETIFKLGTFGFHALERWHNPEVVEQIIKQYD